MIGLAHSFGFQGSGGSGGLGPSGLYGAIAPGYASAGQGGPVPGDPSNGATNEASLAYNGLSLGGDTKLNANYSYNSAIVYHWDNQTDLYIASDYAKVDGGSSMGDAAHNGTNLFGNPALGVASEVAIATGVRFKF